MNIHAQRLLDVAKALRESRNPEAFTMTHYGWTPIDLHGSQKTWPCGTPACALGHYAARPDLQDVYSINPSSGYLNRPDSICGTAGCVFDAGYFGISLDERDLLFSSDGCDKAATPEEAAKYIENFVKCRWGFMIPSEPVKVKESEYVIA